MGGVDLIKSCARALDQVADHLEDAVLYLDAGSSEAFQFVGGVFVFLELGARAVCSLEQASPLDVAADWHDMSNKPVQKMVVMTSFLLSDAHRYILRCLDMHRSIRHCTIFTSISEVREAREAHSSAGADGVELLFGGTTILTPNDMFELLLGSCSYI